MPMRGSILRRARQWAYVLQLRGGEMKTIVEVLAKIRADLEYRTPGASKPLGHIVLERADAEVLVALQPYDLRLPGFDRRVRELWHNTRQGSGGAL